MYIIYIKEYQYCIPYRVYGVSTGNHSRERDREIIGYSRNPPVFFPCAIYILPQSLDRLSNKPFYFDRVDITDMWDKISYIYFFIKKWALNNRGALEERRPKQRIICIIHTHLKYVYRTSLFEYSFLLHIKFFLGGGRDMLRDDKYINYFWKHTPFPLCISFYYY